jgi:sRNA-binding protein
MADLHPGKAFVMRRDRLAVWEKSAKRVKARRDVDLLCAQFPKAFSRRLGGIRPLKHGIADDIVEALDGLLSRTDAQRAVADYQRRPHYQRKIVSGKWRRDLYGNRIVLVTPEEKARAQRRVDAWLLYRPRRENSQPPA